MVQYDSAISQTTKTNLPSYKQEPIPDTLKKRENKYLSKEQSFRLKTKPLKIFRLSGNYLEMLRKNRKRLVTSLFQEISENELMEHLQAIILILRNFSFVKLNENVILKHNIMLELVISLFIDS